MSITIVFEGQDSSATSTAHSVANAIKGLGSAGDAAGGSLSGLTSRAVALGNILSGAVMGGLNAVTGAFGSLSQGMIGGNAEFERYQTQFGVLLKSTDAAKERLAELAKFGAETPFELPEVVRADKILQAFGLHSAESAKKFGMSGTQIRTVAGDVAAGTGAKFEEIANYLGKFSSGATGEAIARMQELGITTRAELASMGVSFSKSGEMTSPVEKGMSVLLQVMQTKFGGMMNAQSSTFEGMMSNLQDWVGQAMRVMGAPIFDALKGQLGSLLQLLGSPTVQNALVGIGQALGNMATSGISALQNLASSVTPFVSAIQGVFNIVQNQGGFMGNMDAWASGLDAAFGSDTTNKIIGFATSLSSLMQGNVGGGVSGILQSLGLGPETAGQVGSAIDGVVSAVQGAASRIQTAIQTFKNGLYFGGGTAVSNFLISLGLDSGVAASVGSAVDNVIGVVQGAAGRIQTAIQTFKNGLYFGGGTAVSNFLISLGVDSGTAASIGTGVDTIISSIQGAIGRVQTAITTFRNGLYFGGGTAVSNFLISLGVDSGTAASIGTGVDGIIANIQGAMGRVQTAIQSFQAGMTQGTPGAAVSGLLSALGIPDDLAGQIGAKVAEINTAIQTAKSNLGTAIQSFMAGWQQGTPGAAVAGFLSAMGVSDDIAGKIGSVVGGIATAIQTAKSTLQSVMQGFQQGGVAGGATALLQSLGLDTSIVGQAQTILGNIATAIQGGIQRVKDAVSAAMSGGGLSGVLSALGLDPSIASQAQTVFNTVVSAVQGGIQRIKDAIVAVASGQGASGVLHALGLSDETVGQIKSVIDRIGAVVGVLAQNFQSGFQQAAAALGPIQGPLKELATLVGGLVVGAFLGLVGFVAGAIPGIANVVAGVVKTVNGVLQFMAEFIKGVISIVANILKGDWEGAWQAAVQTVANMNTRAREIMLGLQQAAFGIFQALVGGIISAFDGLYTAVTGEKLPSLVATVQAKFEELKAAAIAKVQELVDGAKAVFTQLVEGAQQIIADVQAAFASIDWGAVGSNIIQGIADGIRNGAGAIADAARNAAKNALDAAKNFLGIQSPSKVMAEEVGVPMAQGLAVGFASGMDGSALVGIVAGIRAVMEQIGRILKGVGDVVSTSDWEDLSGPVKLMADMFKALEDVGKSIVGGNLAATWATAAGQVAGLVSSARRMMEGLASIVKGAGDVLSTSDWEDLTGPLKLMADSVAALTSVVTNVAEAVKVLREALATNWADLDTSLLSENITRITALGVALLQAATGATAALKDLDEKGLTPLKLAADGIGAAASAVGSTLDLTRSLFEFASNAILRTIAQSAGARAYFAALATDIMKLGAAIVSGFTQAAITIAQPVVDSTKRFADAVSNLSTGLSATIAIVTTLVTLLRRGMPQVDPQELATQFVGPLVRLGVTLSIAANDASQALTGLDTTGLDKLKNVIGGLLDTFKGIVDLIEYVLGGAIPAALGRVQAAVTQVQNTLASVGVSLTVTPAQLFHAILDPILALGVALTQIIADGTAALGGLDTAGYEKLASVMGNAQDTIKKIVDLSDFILDLFTNGGLFDAATRIQAILAELNARLAGMGQGPTNIKELLRQMLAPILALGVALAEVAAEATASLANLETGGLSKLNDAIGGLQTALESIPKLIKQILTDWQQGWPDINPEQAAQLVITPLLTLGMALARQAATATASLSTLETGGLSKLNDAISGIQGALEGIPKLLRQILTTWQQGWPDLDPEQAAQLVFTPLFRVAVALAQAAETAAAGMAGVTTDAVKALGDAANAVLGTLKNTLDVFKLLNDTLANGPLDMTSAGIHPELVDALTTYAVALADAFLAVANSFTGEVTDAAKSLGDALNAALGTAKNALEILTLFNKTLAGGPVDMTTANLHPELIDALATYAVDLATAFLAVANAFRGEVTDGAKQLGDALNAAIGTAKNALEILALFTKTLASGPLDMMTAGLHPELIDALATYAVGLADAFLAVANAFDGVVTDGAKALGDALSAALSTAKNALEALALFGKTLAGGPLDMMTAGIHPELIDALTAYAISLATAFLAAANAFTGQVSDGAKALGDALGAALSIAKNALEALTLFNDTLKNGPLDMTGAGIHPELVDALTTYAISLATAFLEVANTFRGEVTDAAKALADSLGTALGVVKDALEFANLRATLASFKPLDMATYGPKIDLIFQAAKDIAQRFVEKARSANISKDMQDAADALSKVFGDAAGALKTAIETAMLLANPETQIPSVGQIQAKLTAVLNFLQAVVTQFAASATSMTSQGVDFKAVTDIANAAKSAFDVIMSAVDTISTLREKHISMDDLDEIRSFLRNVFSIFNEFSGDASNVEAVTNAVTTLLGGIQTLVSSAGYTAGQTWGQQFAAGIAAAADGVTASAGGAAATIGAGTTGQTGGRALPPGTLTGTTNIYNAPQTMTVNVGLSTAAGLPDTLTLLTNMARG